MNTVRLAKYFQIFVILALVAMIFGEVSPVAAQEGNPPDAWTDPVCNGEAAIVFQSRQETGDGVTVSPYDTEECEIDSNLGWYVVESWKPGEMNPDAGCLAETWSSVGVMARETGWENGSAWRVNVAKFAKHPMVVSCSEVSGPDDLGLNPNENQVQLSRQEWVVSRALELLQDAGMTPAQYCSDFDEPLAGYLCALPAFANAVATPVPSATPASLATSAATPSATLEASDPTIGNTNTPLRIYLDPGLLQFIQFFGWFVLICLVPLGVLFLLGYAIVRAFRKPKKE